MRIEFQGLVDVLRGLVRPLQRELDRGALREQGRGSRRHRAGAVEVGQRAREVAARGRGQAAARIAVGIERRSLGGRRGSRRGSGHVFLEDAPAVVREEHQAALLRDVHAVRQEEVHAQQHVLVQVVVRHVDPAVADDFAADIDLRERRRPGLVALAGGAVAHPAGLHVALRQAQLPGRRQLQRRGAGAAVERRQHRPVVDPDDAADLGHLLRIVVVARQRDLGDGRLAGPVRHVGVAAVVAREDEADDAVGEVVFGVGDGQDVAADDAHAAPAGLDAADDELHVGQAGAEQLELVDVGHPVVDLAVHAAHRHVARQRVDRQLELRGGGLGQDAGVRAAVDHQGHARSVDAHRRDRAVADDLHRQIGHLELALGERDRRQLQPGQRQRAHPQPARDVPRCVVHEASQPRRWSRASAVPDPFVAGLYASAWSR